jgi:outer membrane protein assembly complex protein YaeT
MTFCRPLAVLLLLAAGVASAQAPPPADPDNPTGKTVAEVVPVNNKAIAAEQILSQMHTKPGRPYDPAVANEDVQRLSRTRWFQPNGIEIGTGVRADGRVNVFVTVRELANVVKEIRFVGAQHYSDSELLELIGIRRGGPLNPPMNQLAAATILNKLREDGRALASVELLEGGRAADQRVVFNVVEGPVVRVRGVEFRGNAAASSGRLATQLVTSGPLIPGFVTPLSQKFQHGLIEEDKRRLTDYYHRLGRLEVRVREEIVPGPASPAEVTVVYHITEGPEYTVSGVQVVGNKAFPADRLRKVVGLKPGERFDRGAVEADKERLKAVYGRNGYNVPVTEALVADPDRPAVVQVQYQVEEPRQEPARVGRIIIEGNTVTADRVILNQLPLYPGQVLDYDALRQAEQNLARLGIFDPDDPPRVEELPTDLDSAFRDVRVRVRETRTGMFALTANVNSDAGVNGSIVVNQRNFDITRIPTSLDDLWAGKAFRGGGQELRLEAMPGTQLQRYSATWREPFFLDSRFGLTASGYYFDRAFLEYTESRVGARTTLDYRFLDDNLWRATLGTRIEGVNISQVNQFAGPRIRDDAGRDTLLGLRLGVNRDSRDSFLLPSRGSVLDVGVEQILGSNQFVIGTTEFTHYATLFERKDRSGKQVLANRTQLTAMGANAPVYERAFAGGFRSLRGFNFRGVSPVENGLHVGGTFAWLNTHEYQIPLMANDKLWAVAFCDHGTVDDKFRLDNYRVSVGAGLRVVVPAMGPLPIALDFAVPLRRQPFDNKQLFSFYVGWFGGQ